MPFTLAHAAAILPLRRAGFIVSAFVIGSFGPDFEYFLLVRHPDGLGHRWPGVLLTTLPLCLLVLWIFHRFVKRPAAALLPPSLERRMQPWLGEFRFSGARRLAWIVASTAAGIATHVFWDSFTHRHMWATERWEWLSESVALPLLGEVPRYSLLQYVSSLVGMAALALWFVLWLRASRPAQATTSGLRPSLRYAIIGGMSALTLIASSARALRLLLEGDVRITVAVVVFVVTTMAIFAMLLLIFAAWWNLGGRDPTEQQ